MSTVDPVQTKERILVVDDGADMRDFVINYVVKPNGYEALEARDGQEGYEIAVREKPDLIVLDLQMPRLDGIGLLNKLRDQQLRIPVVLMTFYGSEEIAIEVFRLGVRDYVIKPFTDDELLEAIERSLVETRLRRERDDLQKRLVSVNHDLQRRVQEFQAVLQMGSQLARQPDMQTLALTIVDEAVRLTKATQTSLLLMESGVLVERITAAEDGAIYTHAPTHNELGHRAVVRGQAAISDVYREYATGPDVMEVCVPVMSQGGALGVLQLITEAKNISDHEITLLAALADYLSITIVQGELYRD